MLVAVVNNSACCSIVAGGSYSDCVGVWIWEPAVTVSVEHAARGISSNNGVSW